MKWLRTRRIQALECRLATEVARLAALKRTYGQSNYTNPSLFSQVEGQIAWIETKLEQLRGENHG